MVIITHFRKISREDGLIYIISEEVHKCPKCDNKLKVKDYRERQGWTKYGDKRRYLLRRLQCKSCGAIHIELPDILLPYKRYNTEAVESVLNGNDSDCVASITTMKLWQSWYERIWLQMLLLLSALAHKDRNVSRPETINRAKSKEAGWLKTAVMAIINSGEKVPT